LHALPKGTLITIYKNLFIPNKSTRTNNNWTRSSKFKRLECLVENYSGVSATTITLNSTVRP